MSAAILADLARVKALFQLRAITAVLGIPACPEQHQQGASDRDAEGLRTVGPSGSVVNNHNGGN